MLSAVFKIIGIDTVMTEGRRKALPRQVSLSLWKKVGHIERMEKSRMPKRVMKEKMYNQEQNG